MNKFKMNNSYIFFAKDSLLHLIVTIILAYFFGFWVSMSIGLLKEILDATYDYFPVYIQKFLKKYLFISGSGFSFKDLIVDGIGSYIGFRMALIYGLKILIVGG